MEFWNTLSQNVFPNVYSTKWYNGQNKSLPQELFHESGWLVNGDSRLIGVPRIRQIRVNPDVNSPLCHVPKLMENITKRCVTSTVDLTENREDNKDYGIGWTNHTWHRELMEISPWVYTKPSHEVGSSLRGPSGKTYHDGGYIAYLHRDLIKTRVTLEYLFDTNWIDPDTRVIIVDFTMYNSDQRIFTVTYIIVENLVVGSVKVLFLFKSIVFSNFLMRVLLFFVMIVVFGCQIIIMINVMGTKSFLGNIWNIYDCIVLFIFIYAGIFFASWNLTMSNARDELSEYGKDHYFSIHEIIGIKRIMRDAMGVLFALLLIRLLRIIRFNKVVWFLIVVCSFQSIL